METLDHGASAALVLAGLAVMMMGIAALLWAVGRLRAVQGHLALEQACSDRAQARLQAQADEHRQRMELVQALLPAATGLLGHWLGHRSGRHDREELPPPPLSACCGHPRPPMGSPLYAPTDDDETQVELDLDSLLESLSASSFGDWLLDLMQQAKAATPSTTPTPEPGPGPDLASASASAV